MECDIVVHMTAEQFKVYEKNLPPDSPTRKTTFFKKRKREIDWHIFLQEKRQIEKE